MTTTEITESIQNLKNMTARLEGLLPENNMFALADPTVRADMESELTNTLARQLDQIDHEAKRLRIILNN